MAGKRKQYNNQELLKKKENYLSELANLRKKYKDNKQNFNKVQTNNIKHEIHRLTNKIWYINIKLDPIKWNKSLESHRISNKKSRQKYKNIK